MCPCEFPVPTNAHVRIDYACEVLYVILPLNYIKLINNNRRYWATLGDIGRYWAILGDIRRHWGPE